MFDYLKRPFGRQSGQPIPAMVLVNEVVANLPFCSKAQLEVFAHAFDAVKVHPKLGFGKENGDVSAVGEAAVAPKVGETIEGEQVIAKVEVPRGGELP